MNQKEKHVVEQLHLALLGHDLETACELVERLSGEKCEIPYIPNRRKNA